jgi:hypothetical protein
MNAKRAPGRPGRAFPYVLESNFENGAALLLLAHGRCLLD